MASTLSNIQVAQALPPRLLRFFQRYPPTVYKGWQVAPGPGPNKNAVPVSEAFLRVTAATQSGQPAAAGAGGPSSTTPNTTAAAAVASATAPSSHPAGSETTQGDDEAARPPFNPFLPAKNHATGRWRSPVYSLRVQADLCKLAAAHGVESFLPYSTKLSWVKEQKRIARGIRVRGTGVGQKVKGHIWERSLKNKLEKRRVAMENMPMMIRDWKERGHGRGWKKWPSGKASK